MPATLDIEAVIDSIESPVGRPSIRTPENRAAILECIEKDGMAFSRAAETCNVSASGAGEWRAADPEFAQSVTRAKGLYLRARLEELRQVRTKWGCADPKALEIALRPYEEYRVHQVTEQRNLSVTVTLSGDQLAALQGKWQRALEAKGK